MSIDISSIWDQDVTSKSIAKLNEAIQSQVIQFIVMAQREGIYLRIPSNGGYISFEDQNSAFKQGITQVSQGNTYHNYGLAFDLLPLTNTKFTLDPRPGDGKRTLSDDKWKRVGKIGKSLGFEWGGEWILDDKLHPKFDSAHFQFPRKIISIDEMLLLQSQQGVDLILISEEKLDQFNP